MRFFLFLLIGCLPLLVFQAANAQGDRTLEPVVVSASRIEQKAFDAAASINSVEVDPFLAASPLVNLSELVSGVPGVQVRERQNYAQDLQLSVRGFGTRSTFGVRGVRILIDGIPATMPDGQGQAATATLSSARRIEILRGPPAQLYGNAAGGVVQIFTTDPPLAPDKSYVNASLGYGSDDQRQAGASLALAGDQIGGLMDLFHYRTDGYRDHSAAERTQFNGKIKWQSSTTSLTGILNIFDQPLAQDPLGLTRSQLEQNPRQVVPAANIFDTRKSVEQQQLGLVLEHRADDHNTLNARVYTGTREIRQALGFSGATPSSSGGIVDLNNHYYGIGASWTHAMKKNGLPLKLIVGFEADQLNQKRRGFVNNSGQRGDLRRDETDRAGNIDLFAQADWTFLPDWKSNFGIRLSQVKFSIDDDYVTSASPDDSGDVTFKNASPVLGLTWFAADNLNLYANIGRGFETPTLTESAYRSDASGPNLGLQASHSLQGEIGLKWRFGKHSLDIALFDAQSHDEIVPQSNQNGRAIYQNAGKVDRAGLELSWSLKEKKYMAQLAYTLLDARFRESFATAGNQLVVSGNRLPGTPMHSLFSQFEYLLAPEMTAALEMRLESKTYVNDVNSESAPGYAVFAIRAGREFHSGPATWYLYGRIDNLFDRNYAGSVIVNESNGRFFEPAAGRRFFIGLRAAL